MARYLVPAFIQGAIRRGKAVEQFLGGFRDGDEPALRYLELRADDEDGMELWVHEVYDDGAESFLDVGEFTRLDEDDDDEPAARVGTLDEALALAAERFGARPDRWVNEGMLGHEYLDYLRSQEEAGADGE